MNVKRHSFLGPCLAFALVTVARPVVAEPDADENAAAPETAMDREIRYATGLADLGLPDYAQMVGDQVAAKYPDAKAAVARIKVSALASQGKFKEAEALIAPMPTNAVETMSMRLALADFYYSYGKLAEARKGYETVLDAYTNAPPPELQKFYAESAYKFAQMLSNKGDAKGAVKALRGVLRAKPDAFTKRTVQADIAELLLKVAAAAATPVERKAALKDSASFCSDVMWEQDELFGRALVILAHGAKLSGNTAEARKLITDKMPMIQQIDSVMREQGVPMRDSPMAQCKFLLGTLHEEEGRKLVESNGKDDEINTQLASALGQYFTVVLKYPTSTWAPDACQRIDALVALLKERGKTIDLPAGANMGPILASRYKEARDLFHDGNYAEAGKRYLQALNLAPSYADATLAIGDLAQCYIQDQNDRFARATATYLAERFSRDSAQSDTAGRALLGVAQAYLDAGQGPKARDTLLLFTDSFTNHDSTPAILLRLGDTALRVTNYVDAAPMYQRIVEKYNKPGRVYNDALKRLAGCQFALGDTTTAIQTLKLYYGVLPNNAEKIETLMRIADAFRQQENWSVAAIAYGGVADALGKPNHPYSPTSEDAASNAKSRERALFWRAYAFARVKQPAEQIAEFQNKAIEGYQAFLKEAPKSELAPSALASLATLYFLQNKADEAGQALGRLTKEFPEAEQTKNVQFLMFENLLDLGHNEQAVQACAKMFDNVKAYTPAQFLRVGTKMLEAKQYDVAQKAFDLARASADRAIWEPASLGLGLALFGLGKPAEAAVPVDELLKKYQKTGYLVEANQILGRAYAAAAQAEPNAARKTDLFKRAMEAMNQARKFVHEPGQQASMDMELAAIQLAMGEKGKALAAYMRVFEGGNPNDPQVAGFVEEAFVKMTAMLLANKQERSALDVIDSYLKLFGKNGKYVVDARTWRAQLPASVTAGTSEPQP